MAGRVGFFDEQAVLALGRLEVRHAGALTAEAEKAALPARQGKAGQAQRVDLLLGQIRR